MRVVSLADVGAFSVFHKWSSNIYRVDLPQWYHIDSFSKKVRDYNFVLETAPAFELWH